MKKLFISINKETRLLLRDIEGVLIIFLMPMLLVVLIALIQQRTFYSISASKVPTFVVDRDQGFMGEYVRQRIDSTSLFRVSEYVKSDTINFSALQHVVNNGHYQIGVYIPEGYTKFFREKTMSIISNLDTSSAILSKKYNNIKVELFFDPLVKPNIRYLARSELKNILSEANDKLQMRVLKEYEISYAEPMEKLLQSNVFLGDLLPQQEDNLNIPNTVQHSVTAWILFGMFLICVPLAGNIIKERGQGCLARLKTIPVTYFQIMFSKLIVFVVVCILQAVSILLLGFFVMPALGLPLLNVHGNWLLLFLVMTASAFAATSYGILLGSAASTHLQASAFGSISVVILATVGGVWIPVNIMPPIMQKISMVSPINWGVKGFYNVFMSNASFNDVLPWVLLLLGFALLALWVSTLFRNYQKTM